LGWIRGKSSDPSSLSNSTKLRTFWANFRQKKQKLIRAFGGSHGTLLLDDTRIANIAILLLLQQLLQ